MAELTKQDIEKMLVDLREVKNLHKSATYELRLVLYRLMKAFEPIENKSKSQIKRLEEAKKICEKYYNPLDVLR